MPSRFINLGRRVLIRARALSPATRRVLRENRALRRSALGRLDGWAREHAAAPQYRRVLVDAMWDNGNYWLRYSLLRAALGLTGAEEVGVLGRYNRERVEEVFSLFGFAGAEDMTPRHDDEGTHLDHARALLAAAKSSADLLAWQLPNAFPAAIVYDGILKRQRRGTVALSDPALVGHVAEALAAIAAADRIVESRKPDLVVVSHVVDFAYAALAHAALRRGIPVLVAFADWGALRVIQLRRVDELFCYPLRGGAAGIAGLTAGQRESLRRAGRGYLDRRLAGATSDVGALYAYRHRQGRADRASIAARYGWDPARPMLAVYAPNWFDYPHFSDRMFYTDYVHWAEVTIAEAIRCPRVNFLFKAHPCDEWYGVTHGARLADQLAARRERNLALCDASWNGRDILAAVDGLVTVHGTAGIEAAAIGKPVLLAYDGWYGDAGFSLTCRSIEEYRATLARGWWREIDTTQAALRAEEFAGWYFTVPSWHGSYAFQDDANQDAIFWELPDFLATQQDALDHECDLLRRWTHSNERYYHSFKMARGEDYALAAMPSLSGVKDPRQRALKGVAPEVRPA